MSENNIDMKENRNNLKHLSFEEYFGNDWRKHFQEKETVQIILDATGLSSSHDFVQINSRYLIDDNRTAIIVLIKRKNTEILEKLIIDVIAAQPSFEQFYDVVYNTGSDCEYRVILYDKNSKNEGEVSCVDDIIPQFIDHLKGTLFLYLIGVDATKDAVETMKVNYIEIKATTKFYNPIILPNKLPDRSDYEYAELTCYKMEASQLDYFWQDDEISFNRCWIDESASTEWKYDGIVTEIDMGQDEFEFLFTKKMDEIREKDCSYTYDKEKGILIIEQKIPFQNFKNSLPKEKSRFADIYHDRTKIWNIIEDLLYECYEDQDE